MLAQISEAKDAIANYGLGVGVLLTFAALVVLALWAGIRRLWKMATWAKPWVEKIVTSHLGTVDAVGTSSTKQAESIERLTTIQESQGKLLESQGKSLKNQEKQIAELITETKTTNQLLRGNGICQANAMQRLIDELKNKPPV